MGLTEIEECYVKHGDALVRFAASMVGPADAEDLVAAVMTRLLDQPDRPILNLDAYGCRGVANAARQHWRGMDRRLRRDVSGLVAERFEHHEFIPEVARAIGRLSPQQRAVIHLTYWEDLTPTVVAARLGVGEGTVRRQLARACHKLAEVLKDVR